MNKLLTFLLLGLFLISFSSALDLQPTKKIGFDWDNVEQFTRDVTTSKYGKYEIRNSILNIPFFQLGKVADIELKNNSDYCGINCFAEKEITLFQDGVLIDEVSFETKQEDGSWKYQPIRNYAFSYQSKDGRVDYTEGEAVRAGTYLLRLDGEKKPSRTVDWKIKSNGVWTNNWAVWESNIFDGYNYLIGNPNLTVSSGTTFIAGNQEYDQVYVAAGATLRVNSTIGWLNLTARNITIIGTLNGAGEANNSGGLGYETDSDTGSGLNGEGQGFGNLGTGVDDGNFHGYGGGGAGHVSTGGSGGGAGGGAGGSTYGDNNESTFFIGSGGGGSGAGTNSGLTCNGGEGGDGGAGILMDSLHMNIHGAVSVSGTNAGGGQVNIASSAGGGGGGGSAGTLRIKGVRVNLNGSSITASGGNGGEGICRNSGQTAGGGGGGSGGRIKIFYYDTLHNSSSSSSFSGGSVGGVDLRDGCSSAGNGIAGGSGILFFSQIANLSTVALNSPDDSSIVPTSEIEFNCSAQVTGGATLVNISLWTNESGSFEQQNITTGLSSNNYIAIWSRTYSQGDNILWNCQACDSDSDCGVATENRTFSLDINPPNITVESPNGTLDYNAIGLNETLNVTFTDTNLDSCWYNYNGTNVSIPGCLTGVKNSTEFVLEEGNFNMTIYANDSLGNFNSSFISWDYLVLQLNQTFEENITEAEANDFSVLLDIKDGSLLDSAIFTYNDTNYTTTIIFSSGLYLVTSSIVSPSVSSDTNFSFLFHLVVDGDPFFTASNNQTVINSLFDICGGTTNDTLLNMSLFDEETLLNITGNIEIAASIVSKSSGSSIGTINKTFEDVNYGAICFSPPEEYPLYYLDAEIRYFADDYATEFYHIQMADMTNYPVNLSLYNLNQNDSTEFIITYKNNNFIFTEGAVIQLQRKYVGEDIYRVVEAPITADGGKTIAHIDLNNVKYRATVVKDGEVLDFFEDVVFDCGNELAGECEESLEGTVNPNNDISIEELTDFTYSISIDEDNQTITVLFAVPSGTPSTINVALEQIDMFGNLTSCNTTVITSAGSITCDYTDTIEKSILELSISKSDVQLAVLSYVNDPELDMDGMNFFIVFLFMISLVGMAIASPEWMIIISVMVLIISGTLLLLKGMSLVMGLGAIAWVVIAAAIIIMKMAKQEDR